MSELEIDIGGDGVEEIVSEPMPLLEIDGLVKTFGRLKAVDGISLVLPPGRVHAFCGPNGAGKTTTIKCVTGLLRPDQGTVRVAGHDVVADGVAARRLISYVPDEPYLYERLSGREFLEFTARVYELSAATYAERLALVSARFNLDDFLDQLAEGYSHGMRQRVVLAAAMLHAPRLLIVDEPLVGLDPKHIRIVLDVLREVADGGGSVLMSTHTLAVVETVADSVSVINHGRLLYDGPVGELSGQRSLEEVFLAMVEEGEPTSVSAALPAADGSSTAAGITDRYRRSHGG